jgi:hypothetical protein
MRNKRSPHERLSREHIEYLAGAHPKLAELLNDNLPRHHRLIVQEFFRIARRARWVMRQQRSKYSPHQGKRERARRVFGSTHNLRLAQRYLVAGRRRDVHVTTPTA